MTTSLESRPTINEYGGPCTRGMTRQERQHFLQTNLNKRARANFRYWGYDKPKPTKCNVFLSQDVLRHC
ncbi:hypothetical protein PHET_04134 [Paragonimus heterotremus]|uniref:Uncharacterized protein n=1 Tax=Paragonimus heterotremus TaxID=100268 RepID=A0A8J4TMJ4_9TREM|nr:hypothetical protein PHET_04134 [Paragonimus heterotremus]